MIQDFLYQVSHGTHLSRAQAREAMTCLMRGEATPVQVGAFLVALRMKGETVDEISGFAETMREMATRIPATRRPLVDTCGTGGDRSGTFNISTTAAFVAAGAGVAVAKHGNRSATSKCGSADVLEALGVKLDPSPERVAKCIDEVGIGFMFARHLHTAMKHVAPVRQELAKIPTVFNLLGPLTNPAGACGQVMGVFAKAWIEPLARVLVNLGSRHVFVVAGSDGLDEITLTGPTHIAEAKNGNVETYEVTPEQFGFERCDPAELVGGGPLQNAKYLLGVLKGERGPMRDIVILNSAAAIIAGEGSREWPDALEKARASIDSGKALNTLEAMIKVSHDS
jgi:anthranilate phosphoribosyltransferase